MAGLFRPLAIVGLLSIVAYGRRLSVLVSIAVGSLVVAACATRPPGDPYPLALAERINRDSKVLAVIGDLQINPKFIEVVMRREKTVEQQATLLDDLYARIDDVAALAILGDLVFTPQSRSDWRHFDRIIKPFAERVPILPAIGNHDYYCVLVQICRQGVVPKSFLRRFDWFEPGKPYAVELGDVLLLFFDSETGVPAQGDWLRDRLANIGTRYRALLLFSHRPPYTDAINPDVDPDFELQNHLVSQLASIETPAVFFSGHAHGYEHLLVGGRHFFVSAGGGGPRGWLGSERQADAYRGPDCRVDEQQRVVRPFNYLLVDVNDPDEIVVTARGYCGSDATVTTIETVRIRSSLGPATARARLGK